MELVKRANWEGKRAAFFFGSLIAYILAVVGIFFLTFKGGLFGVIPRPGIIIGSFFPALAFLYYYQHYLKDNSSETSRFNVFALILPTLLIHIIIVFGFVICLSYPQKMGFERSFFSGFLKYGKLYTEFQKIEFGKIDEKFFKDPRQYAEFTNIYNFYATFLSGGKKAPTAEEQGFQDVSCPPEVRDLAGQVECLIKYQQMSSSINAIPTYIALTFGFLGALIFCLVDAVSRFHHADLYPKTFIFYAIRFVVATSLCVTLAYFMITHATIIFLPLIFFFIGYFPERAITYLDEKITKYLGIKTTKYKPIPLSLVQGLSYDKALRLREIGIEDVQHLAVYKISDLKKNLPFKPTMLCDWIAQSILLLYFREYIDSLRHVGIRTIFDLEQCILYRTNGEMEKCAEKVGLNPVQLEHIAKILQMEPMKTRLQEIRVCLSHECKI